KQHIKPKNGTPQAKATPIRRPSPQTKSAPKTPQSAGHIKNASDKGIVTAINKSQSLFPQKELPSTTHSTHQT
ncbi:hypothetical protein, partial [Francisella tularensis]|uniref:hypothetical protein n=1 Tax=Francisella tularensis TaxID=263 RepID=UPI002381CB5F